MTAPKLIGRDAEVGVLDELIIKGRVQGRAMVVIGEPGIGKSALLAVAEARARAGGYRVLVAAGVESEAQLPFAGLHQLLRPVLRTVQTRLRPAHRRALLAAFGLEDGPPPEPFLIALAAVNALAAFGADRPVAVLADDVQWLDPQSQEVLTFIARRAVSHPFVAIGAIRTGHPVRSPPPGCPSSRSAASTRRRRMRSCRSARVSSIRPNGTGSTARHAVTHWPCSSFPERRPARPRPTTGTRPRCQRGWSVRSEGGSPDCRRSPGTQCWSRRPALRPRWRRSSRPRPHLPAPRWPRSCLARPPRLGCSASPTARSGSGIRWCDQVHHGDNTKPRHGGQRT